MSQENVDVVRSIYAAWEQGDFDSAKWAHSGIEFVWADGPWPGRWTGRAGMAEANRDWLDAWEELRMVLEQCRELDSERVFVLHLFSARGKKSGLELGHVRTEGAALFHIRGGEVTRIVHYFNRERALADLGLAPEPGARK